MNIYFQSFYFFFHTIVCLAIYMYFRLRSFFNIFRRILIFCAITFKVRSVAAGYFVLNYAKIHMPDFGLNYFEAIRRDVNYYPSFSSSRAASFVAGG